MSEFTTINIFDLIDAIGEDGVRDRLSDFSCPKNPEIESFVRNKAIDFAKRKISITHLLMDEDQNILAIYTLTHKALELDPAGMSASFVKKLSRFAKQREHDGKFVTSAFLIAQFGKNSSAPPDNVLPGNRIMDDAVATLKAIQRDVGGGIVYLECEDNPKLLAFYQNDHNNYHSFNERYSVSDGVKYIQLLRFI